MTLILQPVPSLGQQLMIDQRPADCTDACFSHGLVSETELSKSTPDRCGKLTGVVLVNPHQPLPFVVADVSSCDHSEPPLAEFEQRFNTTTVLSYEGTEQSINEWALDYGITPAIIIGRLERGVAVADAITAPMKVGHRGQRLPVFSSKQIDAKPRTNNPNGRLANSYAFDGKSLSVPEWSRLTGLQPNTIGARLRRGWSIEHVLTTPLDRRGKKPGVPSNFLPLQGTGAGSTAQETPNITFSGNDR